MVCMPSASVRRCGAWRRGPFVSEEELVPRRVAPGNARPCPGESALSPLFAMLPYFRDVLMLNRDLNTNCAMHTTRQPVKHEAIQYQRVRSAGTLGQR